MPADYESAARALSISPNPSSPENDRSDIRPPWSTSRSSRRLSSARFGNRKTTALSAVNRAIQSAVKTGNRLWSMYLGLSPVQRVAVAVFLLVVNVLGLLFLIYSHAIFKWLAPVSQKWRALPGGWLIIWAFTFMTAFPPMIGYSTAISVSGLSNGFLSTIPSIKPWAFAVSTALASPKLLVHVFIGSRLALLAEKGDDMSAGGKAINYISMILGGAVGLVVGYVIYNRTMARAAELALEQAESEGAVAPGREGAPDYFDVEAGLVDPEDVAALMDDDDISLWAREAVDDEETQVGGYYDDDDDDDNGDGLKGQGTKNKGDDDRDEESTGFKDAD
ncbi:Golgi apparatus membrane protein tvp38 [Colletotrichum sp. SAR11_59]|nr:Golgi apparatus membrane protein tvp38 [Colletotrichum sp. SAR11_59]